MRLSAGAAGATTATNTRIRPTAQPEHSEDNKFALRSKSTKQANPAAAVTPPMGCPLKVLFGKNYILRGQASQPPEPTIYLIHYYRTSRRGGLTFKEKKKKGGILYMYFLLYLIKNTLLLKGVLAESTKKKREHNFLYSLTCII